MAEKELSSDNFEDFISKGNSVIDFWAEWCSPCKVMAPEFKAASAELKDVKFGKVDVDNNTELAQKYGVMSIPTMIFFKDGKDVDRSTGVLKKEDIIKKAKEAFK